MDKPAVYKALEELDQAIAATVSLSAELSPPQLHSNGLPAAIMWLATWMKDKHRLTVDVTADPRASLDQKELRTLAFESVRELLFDVVKHAQVPHATVNLALTPNDEVSISIADEGVGFDPSIVFGGTAPRVPWGLFTIRERVELLGGSLDVASAPGRGTRFSLLFPRRAPQAS
jgi:signal transduction histidine kinase